MDNDLQAYLVEKIKKDGPIPLSVFIETAMTHPELGYYASNSVYPIGKYGDFITAPEVSQMFGEIVGAWVIDIWQQMGGKEITLIECGPGRGVLMADILRVARKASDFLQKVHIRFIETSKTLKNSQKKAIENYINLRQVSWNTSFANCKGPCIILGNEFLDALSIEQVTQKNKKWFQRIIKLAPKEESRAFCFDEQIMEEGLAPFLPSYVRDNKIYEISPARIRFIEDCSRIIKQGTGVALFIDYGHVKTHYGDTLQAVKDHHYAHVLEDIGKSDITSHVDFESLSKVVKSQGLEVMLVKTQGQFLKNLGIEHRAHVLKTVAKKQSAEIDIALSRLVGHKQMGDLFKVLCFYKGNFKPAGF